MDFFNRKKFGHIIYWCWAVLGIGAFILFLFGIIHLEIYSVFLIAIAHYISYYLLFSGKPQIYDKFLVGVFTMLLANHMLLTYLDSFPRVIFAFLISLIFVL